MTMQRELIETVLCAAASFLFVCVLIMLFAYMAHAAQPVPQIGTGCPPGYSSSPTSGYCAPTETPTEGLCHNVAQDVRRDIRLRLRAATA
jgi:hypothetical protein